MYTREERKKNLFLHLFFYRFQLSWWLSQFHLSMISIKIESKYIVVVSNQPANWVSYTHDISSFQKWSRIAKEYSSNWCGLFAIIIFLVLYNHFTFCISHSKLNCFEIRSNEMELCSLVNVSFYCDGSFVCAGR